MNRSTMQMTVAVVLVIALSIAGCMVKKVSKLDTIQVAQPQLEYIVGVTTKSSQEVSFDPPGALIRETAIQANVKSAPYSIGLQDVQRLWVERRSVSIIRTIGLTVGIAAAAFGTLIAIGAATKQSCPFVYSLDGTEYVFDAEPHGGAIARGLERNDYSELAHLRPRNGLYRLLLTNEVDETQFTNMMELWVVDHATGSRVVSDENGRLAEFADLRPLSDARDRDGNNLLPWLLTSDRKIWEPEAIAASDGSLRQEVVLTFPKPEGAIEAHLIANGHGIVGIVHD